MKESEKKERWSERESVREILESSQDVTLNNVTELNDDAAGEREEFNGMVRGRVCVCERER